MQTEKYAYNNKGHNTDHLLCDLELASQQPQLPNLRKEATGGWELRSWSPGSQYMAMAILELWWTTLT